MKEVKINGEVYVPAPMQVIEADPVSGKPRKFQIMYPEESANVEDGMEFWVVLVKKDLLTQARKS